MQSYNIIIVGGGPAGMMAAVRAAQLADGIGLFEKNASLGRKLGLTGKGRCNITNASSLEEFLESFGSKGQFLRNAFNRFFVCDLIRFFEEKGVKLKTERHGRIFPLDDRSASIVNVLKNALIATGVRMHLSSPVRSVLVKDNKVRGICLADAQEILASKVIISTGGLSYPHTGSSGDGFRMAQELGHKVEELSPGLVPLETEEGFVRDLQGLSLKNIRIIFYADSKELVSAIGELLFTHFGVSGPLVLDMSFDVNKLLKKKGKVSMVIDLKPGLTEEQIDLKLQREFQRAGSLKLKNYLKSLLAQRLVDIFLKLSKIDSDIKCHQMTSSQRKRIVEFLKKFPLTIKRTRPLAEAMVTHGGVSLREVNPQTMESKKVKGLYFCGEVLDLAAASGGFNLQAAFSTGYLAGESTGLNIKSSQ